MSREAPAPTSEFKVWRRFTTRWADNDAYGHVNNTVFYQWFDSAVNALAGRAGDARHRDRRSDRPGGRNPLFLFRAARLSGDVDVGLGGRAAGPVERSLRIGVFGADEDAAAAQGDFVHVVVDRSSRRPVEIPAEWRSTLEAIS